MGSRWEQGHALEREKLLLGKTKQEVIDWLGRASEREGALAYDIGAAPGDLGEDLEIDLGPDGRVTRVWFSKY